MLETDSDTDKGIIAYPVTFGEALLTAPPPTLGNSSLTKEKRGRIFRPRCTIGGKLCNLIEDSGSCANMASTTLV